MGQLIVSPAYGRDYKSAKAAKADWNNDKDFLVENFTDPYCGKPINKSQLSDTSYSSVQIRYSKMRKLAIV